MPIRLFLFAAVLLTVAGCDGTEPEPAGDRVAVTATLYQHHYQERDSVVVARLSGSAVPISLEGAYTVEGVEPSGGYTIRAGGYRDGQAPFVFVVEACEGTGVTAFVTIADEDSEPFTRTVAARPGAGGPCTLHIFGIRDFGPAPDDDFGFEIERNGETYEVDINDHLVAGAPAFTGTASAFTLRNNPDDVLSSVLTVGGNDPDLVPMQLYRLTPPGFLHWQARTAGPGSLGAIYEGEPTDDLLYLVFLLDMGTGTAAPA